MSKETFEKDFLDNLNNEAKAEKIKKAEKLYQTALKLAEKPKYKTFEDALLHNFNILEDNPIYNWKWLFAWITDNRFADPSMILHINNQSKFEIVNFDEIKTITDKINPIEVKIVYENEGDYQFVEVFENDKIIMEFSVIIDD